MIILLVVLVGIAFAINHWLETRPTEKKIITKIEKCGDNKIIVDGRCVCYEENGYYPMIGAFGPDHNVCNQCSSDEVEILNGIKVCDPEGLGYHTYAKVRPGAAEPAGPNDQCGKGEVLNKDSKCVPAPAAPSEPAAPAAPAAPAEAAAPEAPATPACEAVIEEVGTQGDEKGYIIMRNGRLLKDGNILDYATREEAQVAIDTIHCKI